MYLPIIYKTLFPFFDGVNGSEYYSISVKICANIWPARVIEQITK
jgi:hypothetical protein